MRFDVVDYSITVDDGMAKVFQNSPRIMSITSVCDGHIETRDVPSIIPQWSPIIAFTSADDPLWLDADIDCGAQRWNGCKSTTFVRNGLLKLGFSQKQVSKVFRALRKYYNENGYIRCHRFY